MKEITIETRSFPFTYVGGKKIPNFSLGWPVSRPSRFTPKEKSADTD
jgi:hypothetical protein